MRYFVTIGQHTIEVDLTGESPMVDGRPVNAVLSTVPGTTIRHLLADHRSYTLEASAGEQRGHWDVTINAERLTLDVVDERTQAIRAMTGGAEVEAVKAVVAPMPGLVVRVEVEEGQQVQAGQGIVVVEAMKMENELKAPADGVVARIAVQAGQTVEKGTTLVVLE